jgi:hypothetical protein
MGNYRDERDRKDKELNLEKVPEMVMETLSPYTTKITNSIKHLFRNVFKFRPKERLP